MTTTTSTMTSNSSKTHKSNSTTTTTTSRTILRIKRKRTEEPLPYLRLEGLHNSSNRNGNRVRKNKRGREDDETSRQLSHLLQSTHLQAHANANPSSSPFFLPSYTTTTTAWQPQQQTQPPLRKTNSVLWKRLEPSMEETAGSSSLSYRIVDALLSNEDDEDVRLSKRRKLTLLMDLSSTSGTGSSTTNATTSNSGSMITNKTTHHANSTTSSSRKAIKILDPISRLVDDSLQQVHAGIKPISDHYHLITTDSRLLSYSESSNNTTAVLPPWKKWLTWCHADGGNLLHACALWNDVEMASTILQLSQQHSPHDNNLLSMLTEAVDGDGRTPYEVAQLSGHDSVCQVLEAFGGDTTNYVYDFFCLQDEQEDDEFSRSSSSSRSTTGGSDGDNPSSQRQSRSRRSQPKGTDMDDTPMMTTVELTSGVAYWTPDGELMFETGKNHNLYDGENDDDDYNEDGDVDSNCEEYGGNDYPEDDQDDDDVDGYYRANRHHHHHRHWSSQYDDDEDDDYLDDLDNNRIDQGYRNHRIELYRVGGNTTTGTGVGVDDNNGRDFNDFLRNGVWNQI